MAPHTKHIAGTLESSHNDYKVETYKKLFNLIPITTNIEQLSIYDKNCMFNNYLWASESRNRVDKL